MSQIEKTPRTKLNRLPARGDYDRDHINAILDEAMVCHIGFANEAGEPVVIPSNYGRDGDRLFIHGSAIGRMTRSLASGVPVCVTVTLVDGIVLARSAFHHSMNYRSVMVFGNAVEITERDEKARALAAITNHQLPGRWEEVREVTDAELNATMVLALPIQEASAKVRAGGPNDAEADLALPIWAGVLPVGPRFGEPVVSEQAPTDVALPLPDCIATLKAKHAW
jgi:hypothetical protein